MKEPTKDVPRVDLPEAFSARARSTAPIIGATWGDGAGACKVCRRVRRVWNCVSAGVWWRGVVVQAPNLSRFGIAGRRCAQAPESEGNDQGPREGTRDAVRQKFAKAHADVRQGRVVEDDGEVEG